MNRCRLCLIPDTRPDTAFVDGVCSACISYAKRPQIDWGSRKQALIDLLDRHNGRCIVPSSGGKDSTAQAIILKGLGADVTAVTATTCYLTPIGRRNIDNLAKHVRTIEVTPNRTVRAKLNKIGLEVVGDISWPEHVAIFTTPFQVAADMGIPLLFYGENPQNQYGGPMGSEEAAVMTSRWRSEFGGFLGLRPNDVVGMDGITARDMDDYRLPPEDLRALPEAHFLGAYMPWDSHENARIAVEHGMETALPTPANWWPAENLDNGMTGIHDHMCWRKYGYGRMSAQLSVEIRKGMGTRETALRIVKQRDGLFPHHYAGVPLEAVLERIGMTRPRFLQVLDQFTDWSIMRRVDDNAEAVPILINDAG